MLDTNQTNLKTYLISKKYFNSIERLALSSWLAWKAWNEVSPIKEKNIGYFFFNIVELLSRPAKDIKKIAHKEVAKDPKQVLLHLKPNDFLLES